MIHRWILLFQPFAFFCFFNIFIHVWRQFHLICWTNRHTIGMESVCIDILPRCVPGIIVCRRWRSRSRGINCYILKLAHWVGTQLICIIISEWASWRLARNSRKTDLLCYRWVNSSPYSLSLWQLTQIAELPAWAINDNIRKLSTGSRIKFK